MVTRVHNLRALITIPAAMDAAQNKEIGEKIIVLHRRIANLSKFIEQNIQHIDKKLIQESDHVEDFHTECERALLSYGEVCQAYEEEKSINEEMAEKLGSELQEAKEQHETARKELQKILLSISLNLNQSKVKTKVSKKDSKNKTFTDEEIQDEELNKICSKQMEVEKKVLKLRSKYYVQAKLHQNNTFDATIADYKKETRILEMLIKQETLQRKLQTSQNLLQHQDVLHGRLMEGSKQTLKQRKSLLLDKMTTLSDLVMSNLAYYQACLSYRSLQAHHKNLWTRVSEANTIGDLTVLATMKREQAWCLKKMDQEIREERKKCENLDRRLDQFSKKKISKHKQSTNK